LVIEISLYIRSFIRAPVPGVANSTRKLILHNTGNNAGLVGSCLAVHKSFPTGFWWADGPLMCRQPGLYCLGTWDAPFPTSVSLRTCT